MRRRPRRSTITKMAFSVVRKTVKNTTNVYISKTPSTKAYNSSKYEIPITKVNKNSTIFAKSPDLFLVSLLDRFLKIKLIIKATHFFVKADTSANNAPIIADANMDFQIIPAVTEIT